MNETNENTYTDPQGVVYDAEKSYSCIGCAFDGDYIGCNAAKACTHLKRMDKCEIIWVKREVQA
jgi:hypothetical protein